jgi:hypothetical protein
MEEDEINVHKDIEFYAAGVAGWLNTRLEHDKSLLTLSVAGIGFLITLLTAVGVFSIEALCLYLMAMISFLMCIVSILWILKENSSHIEEVLKTGVTPTNPLLSTLDNVAFVTFLLGILFSFAIGVSTAVNSYSNNKEKFVLNENKPKTELVGRIAADSVNGFANLKPAQESFNGLNKIQPATSDKSQSNKASETPQTSVPIPSQVTSKK